MKLAYLTILLGLVSGVLAGTCDVTCKVPHNDGCPADCEEVEGSIHNNDCPEGENVKFCASFINVGVLNGMFLFHDYFVL